LTALEQVSLKPRKRMEFIWLQRVEGAVAAALEPATSGEKAPASTPRLAGAEE